MKITKQQLQNIVQEELTAVVDEGNWRARQRTAQDRKKAMEPKTPEEIEARCTGEKGRHTQNEPWCKELAAEKAAAEKETAEKEAWEALPNWKKKLKKAGKWAKDKRADSKAVADRRLAYAKKKDDERWAKRGFVTGADGRGKWIRENLQISKSHLQKIIQEELAKVIAEN